MPPTTRMAADPPRAPRAAHTLSRAEAGPHPGTPPLRERRSCICEGADREVKEERGRGFSFPEKQFRRWSRRRMGEPRVPARSPWAVPPRRARGPARPQPAPSGARGRPPTQVDAVGEHAARAGRQHVLEHAEPLAAVVAALLLLLVVVGVRAHQLVQLRGTTAARKGTSRPLPRPAPLPPPPGAASHSRRGDPGPPGARAPTPSASPLTGASGPSGTPSRSSSPCGPAAPATG